MNKKQKQLRAKKGGNSILDKYGKGYFKELSKKGVKKRFGGLSKEERSERMKCTRKGLTWKHCQELKKKEVNNPFKY